MSDRRDFIALEWLSEELKATLLQCAAMIRDSALHSSEPATLEHSAVSCTKCRARCK